MKGAETHLYPRVQEGVQPVRRVEEGGLSVCHQRIAAELLIVPKRPFPAPQCTVKLQSPRVELGHTVPPERVPLLDVLVRPLGARPRQHPALLSDRHRNAPSCDPGGPEAHHQKGQAKHG